MVTALPELPLPTDRFGDLTEGEQLVLNCFRRWQAGPGQRELLWRSLAREIEPDRARAALKGFEAAIRVLTAHATRNITYHRPCCPSVGPDEVALLTLVTAVQHGQPKLARMVARNFVPHDRVSLILAAIDLFASALKRATSALPLRFAYCPEAEIEAASVAMAAAPTIH